MLNIDQKKEEVARFMNRSYERHLTTSSGGNISLRLDGSHILITPSGTDKGFMRAQDIALITLSGDNKTSALKPSMETEMHLQIYRQYADIHAIIHTHPPFASMFTIIDKAINCRYLGESYIVLGTPRKAPYATMGSSELAANVSNCLKDACCILMESHGILTVGQTLLQAFDRLEVLENTAKINYLVQAFGSPKEIHSDELKKLDGLFNP
jgi:L-fuculose-phosphate aldolase